MARLITYVVLGFNLATPELHNGQLKFWINASTGCGVQPGWYTEIEIA